MSNAPVSAPRMHLEPQNRMPTLTRSTVSTPTSPERRPRRYKSPHTTRTPASWRAAHDNVEHYPPYLLTTTRVIVGGISRARLGRFVPGGCGRGVGAEEPGNEAGGMRDGDGGGGNADAGAAGRRESGRASLGFLEVVGGFVGA
jgi:hypothetical protein